MPFFRWSPLSLTSSAYALLLLNQPIKISFEAFKKVWDGATFRHSVDGGTNHLLDIERSNARYLELPHLITGDFDSLSTETRKHYEDRGVKILETPDQDATDFTKALKEFFVGASCGAYPKVDAVLVLNEPSGRHDQFFANINTLAKFRGSETPVFLVSAESFSWLMCKGRHEVTLDKDYVQGRPFCGLIPLHGRTIFSTEGLRWNLDESMECSFTEDGIISTSNEILEHRLNIHCNEDFFWTMKAFLPA